MFEFLATAPFGLEGVVADELRELGFDNVKAQTGGAVFFGELSDALRANLWLRCADRVLLVVGRLEAKTFDALFEGVKRLPWEQFIPKDAKFPVSGNCARSQLMSVSDCQSITKKTIVERLKQKYHTQTLPEQKETYAVQVALHNDIATLTLDTSGAGLSRRGYRTWNGEAPIRETLAASLKRRLRRKTSMRLPARTSTRRRWSLQSGISNRRAFRGAFSCVRKMYATTRPPRPAESF